MTLSDEHKDHIRVMMERPLSDFVSLGYGIGVALEWLDAEFNTVPEVLQEFLDQIDLGGQAYLDSLG